MSLSMPKDLACDSFPAGRTEAQGSCAPQSFASQAQAHPTNTQDQPRRERQPTHSMHDGWEYPAGRSSVPW